MDKLHYRLLLASSPGGRNLPLQQWYRNWEFDYEPPQDEIVQEEPENVDDENPELPQMTSEEGAVVEECQDVEEELLEAPTQSSS